MKRTLQGSATAGSVWRERDFRLVAAGRLGSMLGARVSEVALLLSVAPRGPVGVGAVLAAFALPWVVLGGVAGRVADRVDSRRVTVATALVAAPAMAGVTGIAALAGGGAGPLASAVALALFVLAQAAVAVAAPSWAALTPRVVGESRAAGAVAQLQSASYATIVVGPALGGALVATVGTPGAFALDALSSLVLAGVALAVRTRRRPSARVRADAAGGLALLRRDPVLGPAVLVLGCFVAAGVATNVAEVLLVTVVLGGGPGDYGAVGSVAGVGLLLGSGLGLLVRGDRARTAGMAAAAAIMGVALVGQGAAPSLTVLYLGVAAGGVGNGVLNSCSAQLVVSRSPDAVRGRVSAAVSAVAQAASVAGLPLGAALTGLTGPRTTFVVAGVVSLVVTGSLSLMLVRRGRCAGSPAGGDVPAGRNDRAPGGSGQGAPRGPADQHRPEHPADRPEQVALPGHGVGRRQDAPEQRAVGQEQHDRQGDLADAAGEEPADQ